MRRLSGILCASISTPRPSSELCSNRRWMPISLGRVPLELLPMPYAPRMNQPGVHRSRCKVSSEKWSTQGMNSQPFVEDRPAGPEAGLSSPGEGSPSWFRRVLPPMAVCDARDGHSFSFFRKPVLLTFSLMLCFLFIAAVKAYTKHVYFLVCFLSRERACISSHPVHDRQGRVSCIYGR